MQLGELKVFVTVATEHSFSRAAIKLCRTQPAVSQAVRRLEEDLGELLFDRSTKSVKLTQAGDALLPERSNCSDWPTKRWPRSGNCRSGTARSCGLAATNPMLTSCFRHCRYSSSSSHTSASNFGGSRTSTSSRKSERGPSTSASRPANVCRPRCAPCRYPSCLAAFAPCYRRATPLRRGASCR